MKLEYHRWPPEQRGGQHVTNRTVGILAIDTNTGVAVFVDKERSMHSNKELARKRILQLLVRLLFEEGWDDERSDG